MQCNERTSAAIANRTPLITQVDVVLVKDQGSAFDDLAICARAIMRCAVETHAPNGYRAIDCARFDLADDIADAWYMLSDMAPTNDFGTREGQALGPVSASRR